MDYTNKVHSKADAVQRKKLGNIRDASSQSFVFINPVHFKRVEKRLIMSSRIRKRQVNHTFFKPNLTFRLFQARFELAIISGARTYILGFEPELVDSFTDLN